MPDWDGCLGVGALCSAKEGDQANTALSAILTLSFPGLGAVGVMMACRHLELSSVLTCVTFVPCVLSLFFLEENRILQGLSLLVLSHC